MDIEKLLIALAALVVIVSATMLIKKRGRKDDLMSVIRAVDREEARQRKSAPPSPILLTRPFGETEWKKLGQLRKDSRYREAFSSVRGRYSVVADPMLLPRTLRETMERRRVGLDEALIIIASGQEDHRVG
ncbi:hypothetical protein [Roseococcus sp.]|uniref:hypothetical protein n=1 Tax=Roseococcus sp. TaxID=2109646 RepID=UPI003BABF354